ncbi:hypothetical protein [Methanosarcina sp. MTP4]|uniref:hypothetical protein n=1 Tax=Methanosarcina sp. MTP4 TaxID=1434100 RepID=UPI000AE44016|nr:hypothetical protein [Methanosarcina sp. MTP4]
MIGIVVGTLFLSYFILIVRMFSEEYLSGKAQKGGSYEAAGTESKSSDKEKGANEE